MPPRPLRLGGPAVLLALVALVAPTVEAQRPSVSPQVEVVLARRDTLAVWLFAQPGATLDRVREAVESAGGRLRRESEWLHAVSAEVTAPALAVLRQSELLRHIQPVARFRAPLPPPATAISLVPGAPSAGAPDSLYGPSAMPFRRLNVFGLADRGIRGRGVRIAILDTGFETGLSAFDSATVVAQRDFVGDSLAPDSVVRNEPGDAPQASRHGTAVWSLLAARVPGVLMGIAPEAEYILAKTEDVRSERRVEEDNYVAALEWAHSLGARVVSSSLGYFDFDDGFAYTQAQLNGDIAVTTMAADAAAQRGILVVTAVGNTDSPARARTLVTPADGDSVVAAGAEDSLGTLAGFSSRGPTADGRIKPDLLAPGVSVWVRDTQSPSGFGRLDGTSFATPLLAGVGALLRELHPGLGPMDIRDALRRTGTNAATPDASRGWGRPDAVAAASFPGGIVLTQPADSLLGAVTPTFSWAVPGAPGFALPMSFRLIVSRTDAGFVLDTTTSSTTVVWRVPQRPGARLTVSLRATAADSAEMQVSGGREFIAPPWTDLTVLDDPAGLAIRDRRPRLTWTPTPISSPPGPFTYDVEVFRADDGGVEARATGLDTTAFTPGADLDVNTPYRWRVTARAGTDTSTTVSRGVFVIVDESIPTVTLLFQNFPNPFPNPATGLTATCIWFDSARPGEVRLEILDLRGHVVRRLVPSASTPGYLPAGRYGRPAAGATGQCNPDLAWDGRAEDGTWMPRGVYLIKLQTPDGTFFKRAVFLGPL